MLARKLLVHENSDVRAPGAEGKNPGVPGHDRPIEVQSEGRSEIAFGTDVSANRHEARPMRTEPQRRAQAARRAFGKQDGIGIFADVHAARHAGRDGGPPFAGKQLAHRRPGLEDGACRHRHPHEPVVEVAAFDDGTPRRRGRPPAGDGSSARRAHRAGDERQSISQVDAQFRRNPYAVGREPVTACFDPRPRPAFEEPHGRATAR